MKKSFLVVAFGLLVSLTMSSCILIVGGDDPKETSIELKITSPTDGAVLTSQDVTISGTVIETNGFGVEAVYYAIDDDTTFTTAVLADGNWTVDTNLTEGAHTLYAYAMDSSNNSTTTNTIAFTVTIPGYLLITNGTTESWINNIYSTTEAYVTETNVWSSDLISSSIQQDATIVIEMAPGTYQLKMEIINEMYSETNDDANKGMHYVVYQTDIAITNGTTNTFTLQPAILELTNKAGASITFMYTSFSADPEGDGYFDLMNLVAEDNVSANDDKILDNGVWNSYSGDDVGDWELVVGEYEFVTAIDGSPATNIDSFSLDVVAPGTNRWEYDGSTFIQ